jgi:hypothetical protein
VTPHSVPQPRKAVIVTSIVLLLLGIAGIVLPQLMSMAIAFFAGWLLIFAGVIALYITWHGFRDRWIVWLKPFVLITVGLLILLRPRRRCGGTRTDTGRLFPAGRFCRCWRRPGIAAAGWMMFNGIFFLPACSGLCHWLAVYLRLTAIHWYGRFLLASLSPCWPGFGASTGCDGPAPQHSPGNRTAL